MYLDAHSTIGSNEHLRREGDDPTLGFHLPCGKMTLLGLFLAIIALLGILIGMSWAKGKPAMHSISLSLPKEAFKVVIFDVKKNPIMVLEDKDRDGLFEIREILKQGKPYRLEEDRNHDGRPDKVISYDEKGEITRMILDRNSDGRPDKWQFYSNGRVVSAEEDSNFDGHIDYKISFDRKQRPTLILEDTDHDGCLETRQEFGGKDWDRKVSIKSCDANITKGITYYREKRLIKRLWDKDEDGTMDTEEYFRRDGTRCVLCRLKKIGKKTLNICNPLFLYDQTGKKAIKAAKDIDSDGLYDIEYDFKTDTWSKIPKDQRNLWEPRGLCKGPR